MTRYFGMYSAEEDEFTITISAESKEQFAEWLIAFCNLPQKTLAEIEEAFAAEGQYIRECSVVPLQ